MFNSRKSINASDLPLAESTHIENAPRSPKSSVLSWSRFGLRSSSSPIPSHSQLSLKKAGQTNKSTMGSLIDPRVVLDAQSNGFASRVVKYHDESEAKSREISNKNYRRPGDFPIVNLDRTEHNLKKRAKGTAHVSTMSLSTPINLVSASERSAIFRTGKNLGETLPPPPVQHEPSLRLGKAPHNEPIITPSHEFDNGLACSSLDALKEISRKRIHCDELDGDFNKKPRPEGGPSGVDARDAVPSTSKRTRDRVSPTTSSSPVQAQKKRYRNNDILSSLSSSISMGLKRTASVLSESTPVARQPSDEAKENAAKSTAVGEHAQLTANLADGATLDAIQRIGKSNSDIPACQTSKPPEQVLKSMSDSSVAALANQPNRKPPKFTLFNKVYKSGEPACDGDDADDDKGTVSYVKPKARTSSLFSLGKGRDPAKSKLSMMLHFLRGQESTDEVDAAQPAAKQAGDGKGAQRTTVDAKTDSAATDAKSAEVPNLLGGTKVTFSTATTTSVLNAPASIASPAIVAALTKGSPTSPAAAAAEPDSTNKLPSFAAPTAQATSSTSSTQAANTVNSQPVPKLQFSTATTSAASPESANKLLSFTSPTAQATSSANSTQATILSSQPVPKLQFTTAITAAAPLAASSAPPSTTMAAAPSITVVATQAAPLAALAPAPTAAPAMAPTAFTLSTPPAMVTPQLFASSPAPNFSFGAKAAEPATAARPPPPAYGSQATATSAAAPTFAFGQSAAKPTLATPTFGAAAAKAAAPTDPRLGQAAAPTFGATPAKPTAASPTAPSFVFGASNMSKAAPAPTFGASAAATSPAGATKTPFGFGAPQSSPATVAASSFQFGGGAQSTAASTTSAFGAPPATTTSPSMNLFGAAASADKPAAQSASPFAFGQSAPKPSPAATATFGGIAAAAASPGLGKPFGFAAPQSNAAPAASSPFGTGASKPAVQSASPFAFGGAPDTKPAAAAPPAFGQQSSAFSFTAPKTGTAAPNPSPFGSPSAQPSTGVANPFGMHQSNQSNAMSTSASNATAAPAFGGSPFNFSNNTSAAGAAFGNQSRAQNAAPPPFGSAPAANNLFSSAANAVAPANQSASNVFGFGQTATTQQSATQQSPFGGNSATPAFGSMSSNAAPSFGSPASNGNGGAFSFPAPKPANAVFGNVANNQQQQPAQSFTFAAAAANHNSAPAPSPFGGANNNSASGGSGSAFAFGGMNTSNNNDAAKAFNFSTAVAPAQSTGGDQPFAFGAPTAVASVPNAFQFNAQPQTNNIFSITPTTGGAPKARPVRALARRNK